tara:strand:- start:5728 stop:6303 length:576 start_codon:yes stop_codon:yes gene_type:complete
MIEFSSREEQLLHSLFSPDRIDEIARMVNGSTIKEWKKIYSKLLNSSKDDEKSKPVHLVLYVDGAANLQKETAGIGGVFYRSNEKGNNRDELLTFAENIGKATNNEAEYGALIKGLELATELRADTIRVFSDSELMVKQINREYKVKNERIRKLYQQVMNHFENFNFWQITHVLRDKNKKADLLSHEGLNK